MTQKQPRTLAICMAKGGVGKTTTAVNLSAALARIGRRVLLIDTDTQNQAAFNLGIQAEYGLAQVITAEMDVKAAIIEARTNLDLLAGGLDLASAKRQIARSQVRGEETVSRLLAPIMGDYDYVIFDTHPSWDDLTVNVMFAAKEIIAPISLEPMAIAGIRSFLSEMKAVEAYTDVTLRYIVPTAQDRRIAQSGEILDQLTAAFGDIVCEPIRYNVRLSESSGHGRTIFEHAPRSNGAADYAALTQRILNDE